MRYKLIFSIFTLSLLLVACTATPLKSQSDIEIIDLQVSPALEHWLPKVSACAEPVMDFGVYVQVRPTEELTLDEADLILRLGEPQENDLYITLLGTEKILIISGEDVPLSSISIKSLQAIFTRQIRNWQDVPEIRDEGIEINQPIQAFSYPEGHEIRNLFLKDFLETSEISTHLHVFSSFDVLQNLLEEYPFSIGYILESQVPVGVKILSITDLDSQSIQHYVLAVTGQEPQGALRQLLLCLQNFN